MTFTGDTGPFAARPATVAATAVVGGAAANGANVKAGAPEPDEPAAARADGRLPDMGRSYSRYISSGYYDRRYPKPNPRTLDVLLRGLPKGGRFLDFGAGTGRYADPLLALTDSTGVASDICPDARAIMRQRMAAHVSDGRLEVPDHDIREVADRNPSSFDLAFAAFGVLGHIAGRANRVAILQTLRLALKPDGLLVASVPNRSRRFKLEQRETAALIDRGELEDGDILYSRHQDGNDISLFYHLFSQDELRAELRDAGFRIASLGTESVLAEETVVGSKFARYLDGALSGILPTGLAYGFLATARPRAGATDG